MFRFILLLVALAVASAQYIDVQTFADSSGTPMFQESDLCAVPFTCTPGNMLCKRNK